MARCKGSRGGRRHQQQNLRSSRQNNRPNTQVDRSLALQRHFYELAFIASQFTAEYDVVSVGAGERKTVILRVQIQAMPSSVAVGLYRPLVADG